MNKNLRFGFEIEGFLLNENNNIIIPPPHIYPTDGFPGLIEIRTSSAKPLEKAIAELYEILLTLPSYNISFTKHQHKFSPTELAQLRQTSRIIKEPITIRNIYNKQPVRSKQLTTASFQINISNIITEAWTQTIEKITINHPAIYGLLPIDTIIRNLDTIFKEDIKTAQRQKGLYSIKDNIRLEYRSLPNFSFDFKNPSKFIIKLKTALENI